MPGISQSFFRAEPGLLVTFGGRKYQITHLLSVDSVLALDLETQEKQRLRVETLVPCIEDDSIIAPSTSIRDLQQYGEDEWAEAQRRFVAIKPLLENPIRSRADAEAIAEEFGIHASTIYKWLKLYQACGHVSALVPQKVGRKTGTRLLTEDQEKIIESSIEDLYLQKQRHSPSDVAAEVLRRCRIAKVSAPHPNTVRSRILELNPAMSLRRRGRKDIARNLYAAVQGEFPGATHPLSVVQIDHTEADIVLVDETHRQPIGRPWLTLAIDVYSRMVVGVYVTFECPSAASVGMCLSQAICPKREHLAELGVGGEWPVWGLMNVIHADNGKDFRGSVLRRACDNYNIDLQWRPVMLPHMGGHIERLMGTMANEFRKLPGATFANPAKRKGYNSETQSALTLREFEGLLLDFIVNVYHQRVHSALCVSPIQKWRQGVLGDACTPGTGVFPVPQDPLRIRLDFMPFFERSVQQYGIQIDNISYYDSVLDPYINATDPKNSKAKRKFIVRRDPRDISKIYFLDPVDDRYVAIPYRNIGYPAMSAWELSYTLAKLKADGRRDVDEDLIFDALNRMRGRVEDAKAKTKAARRQATRQPHSHIHASQAPVILPNLSPERSVAVNDLSYKIETDIFAEEIHPFDEVSLTR